MSIIQEKTKAERVAEYLKHFGYPIGRMDIYGLNAKGYWEFHVRVDGTWETSFSPVTKKMERIRTWRLWKEPEHGEWVERQLK